MDMGSGIGRAPRWNHLQQAIARAAMLIETCNSTWASFPVISCAMKTRVWGTL
jgi:hypothetical protein